MIRAMVFGAVVALAAAGAVADDARDYEPEDGVILHTGSWKNPFVRKAFAKAAALNPDLFFSEISILPENAKGWVDSPLILADGTAPVIVGPFQSPWQPANHAAGAAGPSADAFQFAPVTGDTRSGVPGRNTTPGWPLGHNRATTAEEEDPLILQIGLEESTGGLDFGLTHAEVVTAAIFAVLGLSVLAVGWGFLATKLHL